MRDDSPASAGTSDGSSTGSRPALRFEIALLGVFSAVWLLAIATLFGLLPVAGLLPLGLYPLYSTAAALGWVAGNVYVLRRRILPRGLWRRRLLLVYLLGPPGIVYLLRGLAPAAEQVAAPLVPIYALAVCTLFFFVPVTLKTSQPRPRR